MEPEAVEEMAGGHPKRYNPGELQRTREHLGELTPEEARRMAKRLGGQIGVERSAEKVETGYRKLSELNRRRTDHLAPKEKTAGRGEASSPAGSPAAHGEVPGGTRPRAEAAPDRPGYFDQVRMSFAAARAAHQLKTLPNAVASLFAIFGRVEDIANPEFLRNSDKLIFTPIETLVLAVRQLLARNAKSGVHRLQVPYFQEMLSVIKDWDIEGISQELARLQRDPRGVKFSDCRRLCVMLFRPLVRLGDLDPTHHIATAIKHLHDLSLLALPTQSPDADRVRLQYAAARDSLIPVFRRLRERCYPLLMRLASVRYSPYPEFFREQREVILGFLSLSREEVLPARDLSDILEPAAPSPAAERTEPREQPQEWSEAKPFPALVVRGLEFLDQLFPGAGFARLPDYPDLYPYFQPLFNFPRGVELIPPEDPLQQVITLVAVLQQLFYGFRSIRFRAFDDAHGGRVAVNERIEALTANWHLFLDEVIGKNYASNLDEVCRQLERNRDFLLTDYGDKVETDLQWAKRRFLLPRLSIRAAKGIRPAFASNLPKLPETVRDLRETIGLIVDDVESKRLRSIENPWDDFSFAIEDFLSKRIRLVLSRRVNPEQFLGKRVSNISLIVHAGLVLAVLDYLTTSPDSFYYAAKEHPLYRTEIDRPGIPQYNVALENPYEVIAAAERARVPVDAQRQGSPGSLATAGGPVAERRDAVTGMALLKDLTSRLGELIGSDPGGEHPFVLLALSLRHFADLSKEYGAAYTEAALKTTAEIIAGEIRLSFDLPYRVSAAGFVILLPDARAEDSAHLAGRLAKRFHATVVGPDPMAVSIGIVEYRSGWSVERLLKLTEGTIREAAKRPSPSIAAYEPSSESFIPVE